MTSPVRSISSPISRAARLPRLLGACALVVGLGVPSLVFAQAPATGTTPTRQTTTNRAVSRDQEQPFTTPQDEQPPPEDMPPPVVLEPPVADFGFVPPSETPRMTVKLKNVGDKPLTVLAVQPSCKCTTVNDIVGQEIPAGGSVDLDVSMKAQSSPGGKKADVKVLVDGYNRVIPIQLMMEVTLPIRVVPGYVNAVKGQPQTGRIHVESLDKQPFRICAIGNQPPVFADFDPASDAPRNSYEILYDMASFGSEPIPLFWVIETDREDCPLVDVRLRHETTFPKPVLKMQDYRLTFGRIEQGQTGTVHFEIGELPANEAVVGVSVGGGAKAEVSAPTVDGIITKYEVKFTPPEGFVGLFYAPLKIHTTRRQQEMAVWGLVAPANHKGCVGPTPNVHSFMPAPTQATAAPRGG